MESIDLGVMPKADEGNDQPSSLLTQPDPFADASSSLLDLGASTIND